MKLLWGFLFSGVLFGQSCGELFFQKLQFQKNSLSPLKTLTLVNKQTGRTWGSIEYTQEGMAWKIKHLEIDEILRRRGMGSVLLQTFIKEVATQALQQQYTKAYIEFFQTPDEKEFLNFLSFNHIRHILAKDEPAQWFLILDEDKLKEYSLKNIPIISQAYNQNYGLDYSLVKKIELPRRKLIEQLHRLEYYRSETINWDGDDFQQILDDDLIKKLYAISGEDLIGFALYSIIGNEIDVINFGVDLQYTRNELRAIIGERRADRPGGRSVGGKRMDCVVDYLQFCHTKELAEMLGIQKGNELWPEGKDTESHADGVFMEKCGELVPIYPIDIKVSQNRRTPQSTYVPVK
jgi:predicted GNAT family acetyltransferase